MSYYRLIQDWGAMLEGSCITEEQYNKVYYLDRSLFEVINDYELKDMLEYKDEKYCINNGIETMLFYNDVELDIFLNKLDNLAFLN